MKQLRALYDGRIIPLDILFGLKYAYPEHAEEAPLELEVTGWGKPNEELVFNLYVGKGHARRMLWRTAFTQPSGFQRVPEMVLLNADELQAARNAFAYEGER